MVDRSGIGTEAVTLKAWLRRSDTGASPAGRTVSFAVDGAAVSSGLTDDSGQAACIWRIATWVAPGDHGLTSAFAGDTTLEPATAHATLTCTQVATKAYMPNRAGKPYQPGSRAYLTAYLYRLDNTPVGDKSITFVVDGTAVGAAATNAPALGGNGRAMFLWDIPMALAAGTHAMRAEFAGDNGYAASHTLATLTLDQGTLYLWPYMRSVVQGADWPLSVFVRTVPDYTWQPGVEIEFLLDPGPGQVALGKALTNGAGIATLKASSVGIAVGAHTIRASYAGSPGVAPAQVEVQVSIVAPGP
jgi:hypothetical protein